MTSRDERAKQWARFHYQNPHVYKLFKRFAFEAIEAGRTRLGARVIWERMRWYTQVETKNDLADWRLNDHYPPFYARLFLHEHPEHEGFFEIRSKRGGAA